MRIRLWHAYLLILIMALAAGDGVYAYYQTHQPLVISAENRKNFVHAIAAVDGTRSMHSDAFATAKEIVWRRIIPSVGPGDRLLCLAIGPRYDLSSVVFGGSFEDQTPQLAEDRRGKALDVLSHAREKPDDPLTGEQLRDLARELVPVWPRVENVRKSWTGRLQQLQRPKYDGTSIRALLDGIQAEFEMPAQPQEERWVFLMTDLLDEPPAGVHSRPEAVNKATFSEMHVVLVYPHDSSRDWDSIKDYWRNRYFQGCEISILPFSKALDDAFLLPPGPFAGLQAADLRTAWDFLQPLLMPEILMVFAVGALCCLWDFFTRRQSTKAGASWNES